MGSRIVPTQPKDSNKGCFSSVIIPTVVSSALLLGAVLMVGKVK